MTLKDWFITGGVIAAIALAVVAYNTRSVETTIVKEPGLGAVSTNQPTEPFYFQGGYTSKRASFVSTTTVACMIQNSTTATTTFRMRWDVPASTSTVTVLGIATTTNTGRFATTSAIVSTIVPANGTRTGSYVGANNQNILGPGEWVQVGYGAGTTLPTVAQLQTGTCSADFANIY